MPARDERAPPGPAGPGRGAGDRGSPHSPPKSNLVGPAAVGVASARALAPGPPGSGKANPANPARSGNGEPGKGAARPAGVADAAGPKQKPKPAGGGDAETRSFGALAGGDTGPKRRQSLDAPGVTEQRPKPPGDGDAATGRGRASARGEAGAKRRRLSGSVGKGAKLGIAGAKPTDPRVAAAEQRARESSAARSVSVASGYASSLGGYHTPVSASPIRAEHGPGKESAPADAADEDGFTVVNRRRTPPVYVYGVTDPFELLGALEQRVGSDGAYTAEAVGEALRVKATSIEAHQAICALLDERRVEYHTYSVGNARKLRVVMRGVPVPVKAETIPGLLAPRGIEVEKAERLTSRKWGANRRPMPLVLLTLPHNDRSKRVYSVTSVLGLAVKVEHYRPPKGPTMCRKCLHYGHVQRDCHRTPRCTRCAGAHVAEHCTQPADSEKRLCANCGSREHGAAYKGCPEYRRRCAPPPAAKQQRTERQRKDAQRRDAIRKRRGSDTDSAASSPERAPAPRRNGQREREHSADSVDERRRSRSRRRRQGCRHRREILSRK